MPIITDPSDYANPPLNCTSFSGLKLFERDEERYYRTRVLGEVAPEEKDTHALTYGSAAHCYLLEGRAEFERRFAVRPNTYESEGKEKPWNGNAKVCQNWIAEAVASGRQVLTPKDHTDLLAMADALAGNPDAASLLGDGRPELAIRIPDARPIGRQGRLDWINHSQTAILDIKTIDDANDRKRVMVDRLYYRQLAFYADLARAEYLRDYRCAIVWLEKSWPFRCLVEWLPVELLDIGRRMNEASLARLADRLANGGWRVAPKAAVIETPLELVEIEPAGTP